MYFSRERIRKNYEDNARRDLSALADENGMLNGQGREGLSSLAFGRASVGKAGCESIAVYNAMRMLRRPRPLAEVIRDMERGGYLRWGGHLGAAPYLRPLLRRYGAASRMIGPAALQRSADNRELTPGAVFLMAIWNRRFLPQKGLHTFAAQYDPAPEGDWLVFNRFNSDAAGRRYDRLADILRNGSERGAFLVIYRVYPLDVR